MANEPCSKIRYAGYAEARNALRKLRRQTRDNPGKRRKHKECRPYHCPHCNGYHLTKNRKPHGR